MANAPTQYVLLWRRGGDVSGKWSELRDGEGNRVTIEAPNNERAAKLSLEQFRNILDPQIIAKGIEVWPIAKRLYGAWPIREVVREPEVVVGKRVV